MFNFDAISEWAPKLKAVLADMVPESVFESIRTSKPEYMEDARDLLLKDRRDQIAERVASWIKAQFIKAYHGSRLTDEERNSIKENGIKALSAVSRTERLEKIIAKHPQKKTLAVKLPAMIKMFGEDCQAGDREGQAHLTISRSGLVDGFNHYLRHGSEFDQHIMEELLDKEGLELLTGYGTATLVMICVPGEAAFNAANPYISLLSGDLPNIVDEVITAFAYWIAHPDFNLAQQHTDCRLIFYEDIPAEWICSIEEIGVPLDEG